MEEQPEAIQNEVYKKLINKTEKRQLFREKFKYILWGNYRNKKII
jgi:hypothetical protein